ncbi:hypothetical protein [Pseudoscardovia suis]
MTIHDMLPSLDAARIAHIYLRRENLPTWLFRTAQTFFADLIEKLYSVEPAYDDRYVVLGVPGHDTCHIFVLDKAFLHKALTGQLAPLQLPQKFNIATAAWRDILGLTIDVDNLSNFTLEEFFEELFYWMTINGLGEERCNTPIPPEIDKTLTYSEGEVSPGVKEDVLSVLRKFAGGIIEDD